MSKGSNRRKEDFIKVQNNWDDIVWKKPTKCYLCDKIIDLDNLFSYIRRDDKIICRGCENIDI